MKIFSHFSHKIIWHVCFITLHILKWPSDQYVEYVQYDATKSHSCIYVFLTVVIRWLKRYAFLIFILKSILVRV